MTGEEYWELYGQTHEAYPHVEELYRKLEYENLDAEGFTSSMNELKQRFPKADVWKLFNDCLKEHSPKVDYVRSGAGMVLCVNGTLKPTPEQAEIILRNYRAAVECMPDNMREIHEFVTAFAED